MVKRPQRPTSKPGSTGSARSRKAKSQNISSSTKNHSTGSAAASPGGKTQLTPKPATLDLKPADVKKPAGAGGAAAAKPEAEPARAAATADRDADRKTAETGKPSGSKAGAAADAGKPGASAASPSAAAASSSSSSPASSSSASSSPASSASGPKTTAKPKMSGPGPKTGAQAASTARPRSQRGGTSILAMVLAGGVGGILTLLGAYALLGSGILADDDTTTETRISELSTSISGLSEQSAALSDRVEALASRPAADPEAPAALATQIEALQTRLGEELASNQSALDEAGTALADVQASLDELQQKLATISGETAAQNQAVTDVLNDLRERQNSLEASIANGNAGEAPALAALETRLSALSDRIQDQSSTVPEAMRQELSALAEAITRLQVQMSVLENLQILSQQQQSDLDNLTSTVERVAGKTDRLEASIAAPPEEESDNVSDGARLAYIQDALTTAVADGLPFAGLLSQARDVLAENDSDIALPGDFAEAARSGLTPLPQIASEISQARETYEAALAPESPAADAEPAADEVTAKGLFEGMIKGAQSLVTVRTVAEQEAAPADLLSGGLKEAELAAGAGDPGKLSATLDNIAANPAASEELKQAVSDWQAQARHHQTAEGLQQQLEAVEKSIWARTDKGDRT